MLISFLSLSCSAKREIKLALDIPVDQSKSHEESAKLSSCTDYQMHRRSIGLDEAQPISGFALLPSFDIHITYPDFNTVAHLFINSNEHRVTVPLFILYEEYRL